MAKTISASKSQGILDTFSEAWKMLTQKKDIILPVAIVAASGSLASFLSSMTESDLISLVASLFQVFTMWLAFWGFLQVVRGAKSVDLMKQAQNFGAFFQYVITSIVVGIIVFLGVILLIVPGIYFALKYAFAGLITIDQGLDVGEAMKRSAEITEGRKLSLLGFSIVTMIINIIGGLLFGLGLLITVPLTLLAFTILYNNWKK